MLNLSSMQPLGAGQVAHSGLSELFFCWKQLPVATRNKADKNSNKMQPSSQIKISARHVTFLCFICFICVLQQQVSKSGRAVLTHLSFAHTFNANIYSGEWVEKTEDSKRQTKTSWKTLKCCIELQNQLINSLFWFLFFHCCTISAALAAVTQLEYLLAE